MSKNPNFNRAFYEEKYMKYISDSPELKKKTDVSEKNNPAPEGAITLEEIASHTNYKQEILDIISKMENVDNKSCIFAMYSHGYAFSWTKLKTIADFLKSTPTAAEHVKLIASSDAGDVEEVLINKAEDAHRVSITMSKKIHDIFQKFCGRYHNSSALYDAALKHFIKDVLDGKIELKMLDEDDYNNIKW